MSIGSLLKKTTCKIRKSPTLIALNYRENIEIGGQNYRASGVFPNRLALNNKHEKWLDEAFSAALKSKDGAFIDVGANTGQTLLKVLSIDHTREYVGFEPQLDCSFSISQFISQNSLNSHTILPIGLSDRTGVLQLLKRQEDADLTASTIEGFRPADFYTSRQSIVVVKGDEILPQLQLKEISTVKIDVEGGELEVIEGMEQFLQANLPFVFFEVLNHLLVVTGEKLDEETIKFRDQRNLRMETMLREMGYDIFNILPDNTVVEISKIKPKVSDDLRITDYVAVHGNHKHKFLNSYRGKQKTDMAT